MTRPTLLALTLGIVLGVIVGMLPDEIIPGAEQRIAGHQIIADNERVRTVTQGVNDGCGIGIAPGGEGGREEAGGVAPACIPDPRPADSDPNPIVAILEKGGIWAETSAECQDKDGPNSRTFIKLGPNQIGEMHVYEGNCKVKTVTPRTGVIDVQFACEFAGDAWEKSMTVDSSGLRVDGKTYVKCKD